MLPQPWLGLLLGQAVTFNAKSYTGWSTLRKDLRSFIMSSNTSTGPSLAYIDELAKHLLNVASKADERHESTAEQIAADFFTTEKASLSVSDLQVFW